MLNCQLPVAHILSRVVGACMLMLMDSNQLPQPAPQSDGQFNPGQYDFITNPQKAPKKTLLPTNGSSKTQRVLIVVVGLIALFVLLIVFFSFITSRGKPNTDQLAKVLQQQSEISRVSQAGLTTSSSDQAKNLASKTQISMDSQFTSLNAALKTRKIKISAKQIRAGANAKTDQTLKTAQQNGRYDETFIQTTRTSLEEYQKTLQAAFNGSSSTGIKDLLNQDYNATAILIEDINTHNPSSTSH
jgi:hypothetical protein